MDVDEFIIKNRSALSKKVIRAMSQAGALKNIRSPAEFRRKYREFSRARLIAGGQTRVRTRPAARKSETMTQAPGETPKELTMTLKPPPPDDTHKIIGDLLEKVNEKKKELAEKPDKSPEEEKTLKSIEDLSAKLEDTQKEEDIDIGKTIEEFQEHAKKLPEIAEPLTETAGKLAEGASKILETVTKAVDTVADIPLKGVRGAKEAKDVVKGYRELYKDLRASFGKMSKADLITAMSNEKDPNIKKFYKKEIEKYDERRQLQAEAAEKRKARAEAEKKLKKTRSEIKSTEKEIAKLQGKSDLSPAEQQKLGDLTGKLGNLTRDVEDVTQNVQQLGGKSFTAAVKSHLSNFYNVVKAKMSNLIQVLLSVGIWGLLVGGIAIFILFTITAIIGPFIVIPAEFARLKNEPLEVRIASILYSLPASPFIGIYYALRYFKVMT